jgi:hypothetical protein
VLRSLRQFLSPKQKQTIQHDVFGVLLLKKGKAGPYWLHEAYADDELAISIDAIGDAIPTEPQVKFYRDVVDDVDATYTRVSKYLARDHQKMHRKPVAADWRQTFRLGGIHIPQDGNRLLPWEITFECLTDRTGFLYTCHFENDVVVHVSIDT